MSMKTMTKRQEQLQRCPFLQRKQTHANGQGPPHASLLLQLPPAMRLGCRNARIDAHTGQ